MWWCVQALHEENDKEHDEDDEHQEYLGNEPPVAADAMEVLQQLRLRVRHVDIALL